MLNMLNKEVTTNIVKVRVFKEEVKFSRGKLFAILLLFVILGGFFVWRSLAAEPLVASVEAETLNLTGGASTFTAPKTSSGKAVFLPIAAGASGNVSLPVAATKVIVSARGKICSGAPKMVVTIDGSQVMSTSVSKSNWSPFSTSVSLNAGAHILSINYIGERGNSCENKLFVDNVSFYGAQAQVTPVPVPTLAFSASPSSIAAGQSSTLTWTSTNATSCSASGSWSGDKPLSGSVSTGALNANTTYTLTCQGAGGNATSNTTVSVAPPSNSLSAAVLPRIGVSVGYKIMNRTAADRQFELDKIKKMFNGKQGYVRIDDTTGNQTQLAAVVTDILNRGMTPLVALHGTTGPRTVDTFGRDQAIKWNGKITFFEIANEPDLNGWTPDGYADFVKGTAASIKSGNPNAVVIAGALFNGGSSGYTTQDFCRSLAVRAKGSFEFLSMHLYDDPTSRGTWSMWDRAFPSILGATSTYKGNTCREILNSNALTGVPIISTESGGPVYKYSDAGQSTIVGHDFDALKSGLLPSMAVYTMKNDDVQGFGLLDDNNNERPAYATFMSRAY